MNGFATSNWRGQPQHINKLKTYPGRVSKKDLPWN